jgi:cation diffusion facilitator family transporter
MTRDSLPPQGEKGRRRIRTAAFSVASAVTLCAAKLVVALLSGSLGVLSSAFDSLADIFMSVVNLLSIRASLAPADDKHPYGHGKVETLAALFQGAVIAASGAWVIREGILRLMSGRTPASADSGIAVMAVGTVASAWVSRRIRKAGEETGSPALVADSVHFATDVWSNGGILLALVLFRLTGWKWLDPGVAVAVGLYIAAAAVKILFEAAQELLDRTLPEEQVRAIRAIIESHRPAVLDFHDLRTRRSGSEVHVDFHLVICRDLTLDEAHRVADHIEEEVRSRLGGAVVNSHLDPCTLDCTDETDCLRGDAAEMARTLSGPECGGRREGEGAEDPPGGEKRGRRRDRRKGGAREEGGKVGGAEPA